MKPVSFVSEKPVLLLLFILLFVTLACTCNASTYAFNTPTTAPTALPESPYTPEELANAGTHTYHQVGEDFNCSANTERDLHFSVTFSPGSVEVIPLETPEGGHFYNWVSTNTYSRIDDSGSPVFSITLTFLQDGFVLYSEYTEDGGQTFQPCLRYTRTRLD